MSKLFFLPLLCLFFLTSCKRILISMMTDSSINSKVKILENHETGKVLYFLPIVHIGKPEYYESVKEIIDSLHQEGYTAYYESVKYKEKIDSLTKDTLDRKVRKLIGFHLGKSYKDTNNKSLPKAVTKNKYIGQDYEKIGILESDKHVDLALDSLIRRYEQEEKPIQLLPCDFETDLLDKYRCKDRKAYSDFKFIHTYRNEHIVSEILKSEDKKIIMVYGKSHWVWFYGMFQKQGFLLTYGKRQLLTFP